MQKLLFSIILISSSAFADRLVPAIGDTLDQAYTACTQRESFQTGLGRGSVVGLNARFNNCTIAVCSNQNGMVVPVDGKDLNGAKAACSKAGGQIVGLNIRDFICKGWAVVCLRH